MAQDHRRLGRGLSSLIPDVPDEGPTSQPQSPAAPGLHADTSAPTRSLSLDAIEPNPFQPRQDVENRGIEELAASIRATGILQPVVVRRKGGRYQLIMGERRWRAARAAGLTEVPAVVRAATDEQMVELALVENIHREDLNPIERAAAYRNYCDRFSLTAGEVAERLSEDRTTVTNYLRLLELPDEARALLARGDIGMGHARALLGLASPAEQVRVAKLIAANRYSVRVVEDLVRREKRGQRGPKEPAAKRPHIQDLEQRFGGAVGTKVTIQEGRKRNTGRIVIEYYSLDDFDRIADRLGINPG